MIPSAGCLPMSNVLNNQLDPSFLQLNPLQRPVACYGLEMPIENPNPAFNESMPEQVSTSDTLGDQYLSVSTHLTKKKRNEMQLLSTTCTASAYN